MNTQQQKNVIASGISVAMAMLMSVFAGLSIVGFLILAVLQIAIPYLLLKFLDFIEVEAAASENTSIVILLVFTAVYGIIISMKLGFGIVGMIFTTIMQFLTILLNMVIIED